MNDKFEVLFDKTEKKIGGNSQIDFQNSGVNKVKEKRNNKVQTHLSDSEFQDFINTLKPLENRGERVRELILKDNKRRQKKANE